MKLFFLFRIALLKVPCKWTWASNSASVENWNNVGKSQDSTGMVGPVYTTVEGVFEGPLPLHHMEKWDNTTPTGPRAKQRGRAGGL